MATGPQGSRAWRIVPEAIFLGVILVGLMLDGLYLFHNGYLPPPFVYDTLDNLMDWYNTAYWANSSGAYDIWGAIYPPLSFVFLRIFSLHSCYYDGPFFGRDCDWLGKVVLITFFLLNIVVVFRVYRLKQRATALVRTLALCLGLPMVFALDRGNLILPCFTAFALAHGRLLKSARLRWLALALTVNFKPYLIATLVPLLLRRKWRALEGVAIVGLLVYLVTWAAFGSGSPVEVVANTLLVHQQAVEGGRLFAGVFYGGSYSSLVAYMTTGLPLMNFVGSRIVEFIDWGPSLSIHIGQLAVGVSYLAAAFRPHAVTAARLTALSVALAMSTVEVGGYAQVFLLFLVFLEPWRGPTRIVALLAAYLLCVPLDYLIAGIAHQMQSSYLTGRTVGYDLGVSLGLFVRPGLILLIEYALATGTLLEALKAGPPRPVPGTPERWPGGPASTPLPA